jgi:hypothetical protein
MTELSWLWIAVAVTVPALLGGLIAMPLWRSGQPIFGNIAGTVVIFGAAIGFIMREQVVLDRVAQSCLDQGFTCWPQPSAFTRFAIYAFVALAEVIALFSLSLKVEAKLRRRGYAPEWQR